MMSSIVGSSATIKSTATTSSYRTIGHRSTDIPSSHQHQYHHYHHHQKVSKCQDHQFCLSFRIFSLSISDLFIYFMFVTAHSIILRNNAVKFESGARCSLFGCVPLYIIDLVTLRRFDVSKGLFTEMGSPIQW